MSGAIETEQAPVVRVEAGPAALTSRELALLAGVGALWGSVYVLTKVIVEDIGTLSAVFSRILLGAVGLWAIARVGGVTSRDFRPTAAGLPPLPHGWGTYAVLALFDSAAPFLLISWGEDRIPSATAGILIATAPLFGAIVAPLWPKRGVETLGRLQFLGLLIGFAGVTTLVLGRSSVEGSGGGEALLGDVAILLAALSFALAALYTRHAFAGRKSLVPATGATTVSALAWALPWLVLGVPDHGPEQGTVVAILLLGFGGTALAYLFYFELIRSAGGPRALMATYLSSAASLFYGAIVLGEAVTAVAVAGLGLIVLGVAVTSRARGGGRRRAVD